MQTKCSVKLPLKCTRTQEHQPYRLYLLLALFMFMTQALPAVDYCQFCNYRTSSTAVECPRCLRLIKWPMHPSREHRARIVVRSGKDAFIRNEQSQTRKHPANRNSGGDTSGPVGSWGGPTALRYLVKFHIREAFSAAGVDIKTFNFRRARLKLTIADNTVDRAIPVVAHPMTREFAQGSGSSNHRPAKIDGCTWFYSAPHIVWHRAGGDFSTVISAYGKLGPDRTCFIDVTEIIRQRIFSYQQTGKWNDPGLILMGDARSIDSGHFVTIYSFAARSQNSHVLAPELLIE